MPSYEATRFEAKKSTALAISYIESFNGKLHDECLNRAIFQNGDEAQVGAEVLGQEDSSYQPDSLLGYLAPVEFATGLSSVRS
jgi:putative transposase